MNSRSDRSPVLRAGVVLGVGLGGFVDGIVLHQLLQWHHLVSSANPPISIADLEANVFWDGLFHSFTWIATTVGIALLWNATRRQAGPWPTRYLLGAVAIGWGLFNLVEGIINHHILGIHHVREDVANVMVWDISFLAFSALLTLVGAVLVKFFRPTDASQPSDPSPRHRYLASSRYVASSRRTDGYPHTFRYALCLARSLAHWLLRCPPKDRARTAGRSLSLGGWLSPDANIGGRLP